MDWIKKELRDEIDFVVWTGDSARHDNDEVYPRSEKQVVGLNDLIVQKFFEVFGKHNGDEEDEDPNNDYIIPIIPTFGNNDILPHNIFRQGPNKWTRIYTKVWRQFIPEVQRHQFEQGGWFYVEVIPGKLAVFSLNTLYFFTSNAAHDGCALPSEPGYQQMEWLRIQLQFMRDRGMKVILTGHVPPTREESKTSWDETCWQKYTLWLRQYRDIVITSLYGHFNYDHFILQDFEDVRKGTRKGRMPDYNREDLDEDEEFNALDKAEYFVQLRDRWSQMPKPPKSVSWVESIQNELDEVRKNGLSFLHAKKFLATILKSKKKKRKQYFNDIGGEYAERYAASFISASVVPNLYPALRVFEYNISGLDGGSDSETGPRASLPAEATLASHSEEGLRRRKKHKNKKGKKKYKFEVPEPPSKSSPPGPAYSPQTLSLTRYTQYLANLTHINNDFATLSDSETNDYDHVNATGWKPGKHKGKKPHDKDHEPAPRKFKYEVHYDTRDDDVYQLKDLTMRSLVDLATRIGQFKPEHKGIADGSERQPSNCGLDSSSKKHKKHEQKRKSRRKMNEPWFTFVRRAFVETLSEEELHDEFGS